jgi:serine/threonine protein kinase
MLTALPTAMPTFALTPCPFATVVHFTVLQGPSAAGMMQHSQEVSRTFAAVQALEGSVRAGSAFYATNGTPTSPLSGAASPPPEPEPEITAAPAAVTNASSGRPPRSKRQQQQQQQQQSELCPQLVEQLTTGLAGASNSQKFIEATQKVGSLMYMAPEVLTGHQYNEKIDVFSFGIILYELLSGVVIAGRVAMGGEHDELLDYARKVGGGLGLPNMV